MSNGGSANFMSSSGALDFSYPFASWLPAVNNKYVNSSLVAPCNSATNPDPDNHYLYENSSSFESSSLSLINLQLWREELRSRMILAAMSYEGRRFLEKELEAIDDEIIGAIINVLKHNIHDFMVHYVANFVIRKVFELFIKALVNNSVDICTDKDGCSMIKKIITYVDVVGDLSSWELLTFAIARQTLPLAEDDYGNCIVQYMVELWILDLTTTFVDSLFERFVSLSKNKFGSCMVKRCLQCTTLPLIKVIIKEIGEPLQFLSLVKNVYGNYVVHTALQVSHV
ncbi:pumilio domain-containing protein C6G9.14-like [Andrographis paniculata]|uniref:pumilio domain-containing protein C6G9.14-like n=1 Tax=Andrographis paniculata TaxID=175694 RepID=UPI0021E79833|nr:pumilio domain-containing protein C6G9.14-like [Andrographis paniculata]